MNRDQASLLEPLPRAPRLRRGQPGLCREHLARGHEIAGIERHRAPAHEARARAPRGTAYELHERGHGEWIAGHARVDLDRDANLAARFVAGGCHPSPFSTR